jgi:hypothetical protein
MGGAGCWMSTGGGVEWRDTCFYLLPNFLAGDELRSMS